MRLGARESPERYMRPKVWYLGIGSVAVHNSDEIYRKIRFFDAIFGCISGILQKISNFPENLQNLGHIPGDFAKFWQNFRTSSEPSGEFW